MNCKPKYTFSFYTMENQPTLRRRPWWKLFGRDQLVPKQVRVRKTYSGIPHAEAKLLMKAFTGDVSPDAESAALRALLLRLIGDSVVQCLTLEVGQTQTPYISTSRCSI